MLGATDPSSGTASLHEVIRGFGALLARGWKPLRTILIASWDAEEYGLVGSTEWGEDFTKWINQHVVAYLNLGKYFRADCQSPSLLIPQLKILLRLGRGYHMERLHYLPIL